jgi:hypothetical protein
MTNESSMIYDNKSIDIRREAAYFQRLALQRVTAQANSSLPAIRIAPFVRLIPTFVHFEAPAQSDTESPHRSCHR